MGTKKNRWSEKDIKTLLSTMDKKGFNAKSCIAVAKKLGRSSSAVQNKYRALTGKNKTKISAVAPGHVPAPVIDEAEKQFQKAKAREEFDELFVSQPSFTPEPKVEVAEHAQEFIKVRKAKLVHYKDDILILQVDGEIVIYNI